MCLKKYDTINRLWRNVIIYIKFGVMYSIFIEFEDICTINLKEKRSGNPETQNADKKKKNRLQKTRKIWATVYAECEEMYSKNVELKTYVKIYVEFEDIC